jgi:LPS sulfotransferase NodH
MNPAFSEKTETASFSSGTEGKFTFSRMKDIAKKLADYKAIFIAWFNYTGIG